MDSSEVLKLPVDCISQFKNACLTAHNNYRSLHMDTPHLIENKTIVYLAENYAAELAAKNVEFIFSRILQL